MLRIEVPDIDKGWQRASYFIRVGNIAALKALFNEGVDPNLQGRHGYSLLHMAVHHRSEVVVRLLVEKEEVNVNIRDNKGRTPLWEAVSRGYKAVVELLLDSDKVDPDAKDENGRTPLCAAVIGRGGISLSAAAVTVQGFVIPAAITTVEGIVELLLASGRVDPDAKDARGLTPLAWVSRAPNGSVKVAEMLLSTGRVDANSRGALSITPLLWSAASCNDKMQDFLLSTGKLDENLRPSKGYGDVDSRYITHWIGSCDAQHGTRCKPASLEHKSSQQLPHWVIDVGRGCLVPGNTVPRYVALSYVWSQGSFNAMDKKRPIDSILLKKLNLSAFQTPDHLKHVWSRLPTAVKDAILLVRELEEHYLWVDCLCIVQDDEKTREQVDHMGDIYSGAHFTIIAATLFGQLSSSWVGARGDDEVVHM